MAFVHVGWRVSGRATRLTRSTAQEARPHRRGGDLIRSGAPDMSGISRQSGKPRGIPDRCATFFPPPISSPTIVVNSSHPSFSGSLRSTFSGSLCPPSAGHCDLTSAGHCDLTSAGHCDLPLACHSNEL